MGGVAGPAQSALVGALRPHTSDRLWAPAPAPPWNRGWGCERGRCRHREGPTCRKACRPINVKAEGMVEDIQAHLHSIEETLAHRVSGRSDRSCRTSASSRTPRGRL